MTDVTDVTDVTDRQTHQLEAADFEYRLPPELIAQRPRARGSARLFYLGAQRECAHSTVGDLGRFLCRGDRLVVNDTRVLPARLLGSRLDAGGNPAGAIELLLLEPSTPTDRDISSVRRWWCLAKPGRRARPGTALIFTSHDSRHRAPARVKRRLGERFEVEFENPIDLDTIGRLPLPPYIDRPDDEQDRDDYQTVFARRAGAVAAPTAGLHFTNELLSRLEQGGIETTTITLHVGAGTFRPVQSERIEEHSMHAERYEISQRAASEIAHTRSAGGRIVAVGTTTLRALESAALINGSVQPSRTTTDLFIRPGFRFRVADLLLTNFHLPRSTLLMLVSAFAGRTRILEAYTNAINRRYRFYSYGDAMLLDRVGLRL